MRLAPLACALALLPPLAGAGDLVGPETCRGCHPASYDAWRASAHSRALEALPERSRADRRCLPCHAPSIDEGLPGVGCEECHGPGRRYAARYVMRDAELARAVGLQDPGERTCLACHTGSTPSLERFDYRRKVQLIAHGGGRAAGAPAASPGAATPPPAR